MATFIWTHDYGAALDVEPRVLRSSFGDGYSQVVLDGINVVPRKWALTFDNRAFAEADAIHAFLKAHCLAFDWTDPDGEPGRWECKSWRTSRPRALVKTVTATFDEVFGR